MFRQDIIHAVCSNKPPMMFDICDPTLRDLCMNRLENWYPQSPLRVMNDGGFTRIDVELQGSFEILRDAFQLFEMLCVEVYDEQTGVDQAEAFGAHRNMAWAKMVREEESMNEDILSSPRSKAEGAIVLAAKIHFRAVVMRTPHHEVANVRDMKKLEGLLRGIDLGFWKIAHYVYLWM